MDIKSSLLLEGSETDIEKLNDSISKIDPRVSGDSCNINNSELILTLETEVGLWLEKKDIDLLGMFWYFFRVLVAMASKRLTEKERTDQKYSSDHIQTSTLLKKI